MPTFEELCRGFCAIEGLPTPGLDAGRDGLQAFTLDVDEVNLTVVHDSKIDPEALFLVAELGELPVVNELQSWLALLDANYWLRSENAPTFSRNPETGTAVFQWTLPFKQSTPESLHKTVATMSSLARRWHPNGYAQALPPPRELGAAAFA